MFGQSNTQPQQEPLPEIFGQSGQQNLNQSAFGGQQAQSLFSSANNVPSTQSSAQSLGFSDSSGMFAQQSSFGLQQPSQSNLAGQTQSGFDGFSSQAPTSNAFGGKGSTFGQASGEQPSSAFGGQSSGFGFSSSQGQSGSGGGLFGASSSSSGQASNGFFSRQPPPVNHSLSGPQSSGFNFGAQIPQPPQYNPFGIQPISERSYPLKLGIGIEDKQPNLTIRLNNFDEYQVVREVLETTTDIIEEHAEGRTLSITLPFLDQVWEVLFWLHYKNHVETFQRIMNIDTLLKFYIIGKTLKIKEETKFYQYLLYAADKQIQYLHNQISQYWDKKLIPIEFARQVVMCIKYSSNGGLFGSSQYSKQYSQCDFLFSWLGERYCETQEDIDELVASEEYKQVYQTIKALNAYPQDINSYLLLIQKYHIAADMIKLSDIARGLRVI